MSGTFDTLMQAGVMQTIIRQNIMCCDLLFA